MAEWTFLTNHALVLILLARHPRITALEAARRIGITERAVRGIIAALEQEGYITKFKDGRRITYSTHPHLSFRHPSQQDKAVGDLLQALGAAAGTSRGDVY